MEHVAAIKLAEALAISHKCEITLENIAPVYVPEGYDETPSAFSKIVSKVFENGSVVHLSLLPF